MKMFKTLAVATLLAVTTWGGSSGGATTPAPPVQTATSAPGIQYHGLVTRPKRICGYSVHVTGQPGTLYEVFVDFPALGGPTLITSGIIPAGGGIGVGLAIPGCTNGPHVMRGRVWSRARQRIRAKVTFF